MDCKTTARTKSAALSVTHHLSRCRTASCLFVITLQAVAVCTFAVPMGDSASCSRPYNILHSANTTAFSPWPCRGHDANFGDAVAVTGHPQPFHDFFGKVRSLQPVTVLVLGGSIGACNHLQPGECWTVHLLEWFDTVFPGHKITIMNAGVHSTTSAWAARCFTSLVPPHADLVIVEYAFNDGYDGGETTAGTVTRLPGSNCDLEHKLSRKGYERLLQKILTFLPAPPAVLGLQVQPPATEAQFWRSAEDELAVIYRYYNLPSVSFRDAYMRLVEYSCECFVADNLTLPDGFHPNGPGHILISRLVTNLFATIVSAPEGVMSKWVYPDKPLFRNNKAAHTACLSGILFRNLVDNFNAEHPGRTSAAWMWVEENDKPGFASHQPGSVLSIPVSVPRIAHGQTQELSIGIAYLRSYHDVGVAEISCEGSCTCTASRLNSYNEAQNSQQFFFHFDISMIHDSQEQCAVIVLVSEESSTNGHLVKISGITWEEGHQGAFATGEESGKWFATRQPVPT